jgi:hypothetical protein
LVDAYKIHKLSDTIVSVSNSPYRGNDEQSSP